VIDGLHALLQDSYRLRYQVYCVERQFLPAAEYPQGVEIDEFDPQSVHVGVTNLHGHLAGTARLILPIGERLPTLEHCADVTVANRGLWASNARWVEASRLAVSRHYGAADRADGDRAHVFLTILKGLYQASKRLEATHWIVSIERSLHRLLARAGFPFRQVGPAFDYMGIVAPYSLDLREFEGVIESGQFPALSDFTVGLEPGHLPEALVHGPEVYSRGPAPTNQLTCTS